MIEADKVKPSRLQDILFTGTGKKGDNNKFGPVVANSINSIWLLAYCPAIALKAAAAAERDTDLTCILFSLNSLYLF